MFVLDFLLLLLCAGHGSGEVAVPDAPQAVPGQFARRSARIPLRIPLGFEFGDETVCGGDDRACSGEAEVETALESVGSLDRARIGFPERSFVKVFRE